jgi:hypothetical protein
VVVWAGETDLDVTFETSPTPLSMLTVLAPETVQDKVASCPAVSVVGVAVNEVMVGTGVTGFEPTCTCPLAGVKPLADAVMIADPLVMPFTVGARLGVVAPCGMKMFSGPTVTFEGSLLVSVMNTPSEGAAVDNVTWNDAALPGAIITLAGKIICTGIAALTPDTARAAIEIMRAMKPVVCILLSELEPGTGRRYVLSVKSAVTIRFWCLVLRSSVAAKTGLLLSVLRAHGLDLRRDLYFRWKPQATPPWRPNTGCLPTIASTIAVDQIQPSQWR